MITKFALILALAGGCKDTGPTTTAEPTLSASLGLTEIATGLNMPVYLTAPTGDSRLFIVEKPGRIRIVKNRTLLTTPFLDITSKVKSSGLEQGLLSIAFHPNYSSNEFFYVNYTDLNGDTRIERYTAVPAADFADASSAKLILTIPQPYANHNGGLNLFGPDGFLYIGMGDGGSGGDPKSNGQNKDALLGKLLRIDVDHGDPYSIPSSNPFASGGGRGEVWAYGLRNPWRYSFDAPSGLLYIGDVGQNKYEEVDVVSATAAGLNFGWNIMEGASCFNASTCTETGLQQPALSYGRPSGECSVIGGYVYRGSVIPEMVGHYVYGDYCASWIKSFKFVNGAATDKTTWSAPSHGLILSFGKDSSGELYLLSSNGKVYKLVKG